MSQSQLAAAANEANDNLVELKAQGENSQLFQESIMGNMQHHQRQSRLSHNTGPLSGAGAQILGGAYTSGSGPLGVESRITMNLEDVVLHE